jgi:hypothetical protein
MSGIRPPVITVQFVFGGDEMAGETLREISDKIGEVDSLIFKADTGQITLTWDQYKSLHKDGEALMKMLAESLAHFNGSTAAAMYEERDKVRRSSRFAATVARYAELHPEDDPELNAIFKAAFGDDDRAAKIAQDQLAELWASMFVNKPVEPLPTTQPPTRTGLYQRIFRRSKGNS